MLHRSLLFFLSLGLALSTAPGASAAQSPQIPLNPKTIPQFVDPLPSLDPIIAGSTQIELNMKEFQSQVLSTGTPLPALGVGVTVGVLPPTSTDPHPTWTYVWGYLKKGQTERSSYLGPVILATRDNPTEVNFVNNLGTVNTGNTTTDTKVEFYKYSIDQTLYWADPFHAEANPCAEGTGSFTSAGGRKYPTWNTDCANNYAGPIPAVVHLHGGEVPPVLDGGPDSWFTSTGQIGPGFYSKDGVGQKNYAIYRYPNSQEAANIWFHDHALGITRLNVYAGLAGGYLINDPALSLPLGLNPYGLLSGIASNPPVDQSLIPLLGDTPIVPLVIQDRMFDTNGQLFFPGDSAGGILWSTNPEHPYWVPEFVGDTIVVNGKTWPFLSVQAKRYRFLFVNGSNARTYELSLPNPVTGTQVPFYVIGTDGGYLNAPALTKVLTIMPGERYDVIIDFAGSPNTNLVLKNTGKTPYPRGAQPQGATIGRIIQFRVGPPVLPAVDNSYNPALGTPIRPVGKTIVRLPGTPGGPTTTNTNVQLTRLLTLNEDLALPVAVPNDPVTNGPVAYPGGPIEILVNNTKYVGKFATGDCRGDFTLETFGGFNQCYSELPNEGTTEVWEIANLTADAHPMHLHAVQFQIINRQNLDVPKYNAAYNLAFPAIPENPLYPGGVYIPGYGPPLNYDKTLNSLSGGKFGGNPDVALYLKQAPVLPALQEQGWKDTVVVMPGMVTRLSVRWAPTDIPVGGIGGNTATLHFPFDPGGDHGYVWHCHIIDHEDNEMMRPTYIKALSGATRSYVKGTDY
jgi:FtsP/CotA-like multicopper oxidase with cupredoxin domain